MATPLYDDNGASLKGAANGYAGLDAQGLVPVAQLPAGLPSVASISQIEIDFGATGVSEASFLITDANVSTSSKLIGTVAYVAPTGKDLDELDMDQLDLKFAPGTGQFTLYATALNECLVADKFIINYQVGA